MELFRHRGAADDAAAFKHPDRETGSGQIAGTGKAVVAAADNDDIMLVRGWPHARSPNVGASAHSTGGFELARGGVAYSLRTDENRHLCGTHTRGTRTSPRRNAFRLNQGYRGLPPVRVCSPYGPRATLLARH